MNNLHPLPKPTREREFKFKAGFTLSSSTLSFWQASDSRASVIMLTESTENQGMSITNGAESAYYAAWVLCGKPWPCIFIEHYTEQKFASERFDQVLFLLNDDKSLVVKSRTPRFMGAVWKPLSYGELRLLLNV